MMQKIIRKIGDSVGIIFNKEEQSINNLKKGYIVDVTVKEVKIEK